MPEEIKKKAKDEKRGSFYWINEKPFVSVTQVLRVIDKPALRYWFGKEVYYAMVKNPALGEQEALSAPYKTSDKARLRGSAIHSVVEAYKRTGAELDIIPDELKPYIKAFYKWVVDNKVRIEENEKTVVSRTHRYAGTLDVLMSKNGDKWIIDIKTGKDIYQESYLQLSAYRRALEEDTGIEIKRMGVLLLQENGKYKFAEGEDYFDAFMAAKKLWEFLNKDVCAAVGYV